MTRPAFQCERCRHLEWRDEFRAVSDRNGVRHHERCTVIARDRLVTAILTAAVREVDAPDLMTKAELRAAVIGYKRWRREHEEGAQMARKGSGDE